MRRFSFIVPLALLAVVACDGTASQADAAVRLRRRTADLGSAANDATAEAGSRPATGDAEVACGAAVLRAETGADGAAALFDPETRTAWSVAVKDDRGEPLAGATVAVVPGEQTWTALVQGRGVMPALAVGTFEAQTVRVDARAQLVEGAGAGTTEPGTNEGGAGDCAEAAVEIRLEASVFTVGEALARRVAASWLDARCADPAWAASCDVIEALMLSADPRSPGTLQLPVLAPGAERGDANALMTQTCADRLPGPIVGWLAHPADAPHPLVGQLSSVGHGFEALLARLSTEPPVASRDAERDLRRALSALARVAALVQPGSFEVHGDPAPEAFLAHNGFVGAAGEVKSVAAALGLGPELDIPAPYDRLLVDPRPAALSDVQIALTAETAADAGLGDGLDCPLAVVLAFGPVEVERGIELMLVVLEAAADRIEARAWPEAPAADAGPVPDAAPPTDAAPPPDAAPPTDVGPPPPDAAPPRDAGPARPPCVPDAYELNDAWRDVVGDDLRLPLGGGALEDLTLMPGDEDWYAYNIGPLSLNVSVRVEPSGRCASVNQPVCVTASVYSWTRAEGLLDDELDMTHGPVCGDLRAGLAIARFGVQALQGEPWSAIVVHVYREADDDPGPAGYRLTYTH